MERFSPKIEIINHFDNLVNRIDIDFDICLSIYDYEYDLSKLLTSSESDRKNFSNEDDDFYIKFFSPVNPSKTQTLDLWPESTKVKDYLNRVRLRAIKELKKAQEKTLENYTLNSADFKKELTKEKNMDKLKSKLFAENFYFQIEFTQSKQRLWAFNIFTFVTDFYISPSDIDSLE